MEKTNNNSPERKLTFNKAISNLQDKLKSKSTKNNYSEISQAIDLIHAANDYLPHKLKGVRNRIIKK